MCESGDLVGVQGRGEGCLDEIVVRGEFWGREADDVAEWSNARDSKSRPLGGPGWNPGIVGGRCGRNGSVSSWIRTFVCRKRNN